MSQLQDRGKIKSEAKAEIEAKAKTEAETKLEVAGEVKDEDLLLEIREAFPEGDTTATVQTIPETRAKSASKQYVSAIKSESRTFPTEDSIPDEWQIGDVLLDVYEVKPVETHHDQTMTFFKGGMGQVYRVHHKNWNIDLAIKNPRPRFFTSETHKQNYIQEGEAWVSLGLHPHIVSCFYVRSLGKEKIPRFFAEYVEGGSLEEWIQDGRLYEGGKDAALERILDIAIQMAWGLDYAHEFEYEQDGMLKKGLIHRDFKPGNVMMTLNGLAKVTDFGGGITPAYCSPEQVAKKEITRQTDIWSWGISVLEMFVGGITWPTGQVAHYALDSYFKTGPKVSTLPLMPVDLIKLLTQCFQKDTSNRPTTMVEVASTLQTIYIQTVGRPFTRQQPKAIELRADSLNNKALSLMDLGHTAEACQAWEAALAMDPHHLHSLYNYGLWQWRCGKQPDDLELVRQLEKNAGADPQDWEARTLLGKFHLERLDLPAAREALQDALKISPSQPEILKVLAELEQTNGADCKMEFSLASDCGGALTFTPDGQHVLCGDDIEEEKEQLGVLRVWSISQGTQVRTLKGHRGSIQVLRITADGKITYTGGADGTLRAWNLETGDCMWCIPAHEKAVEFLELSEQEGILVSTNRKGNLKIWKTASGENLDMIQSDTNFLGAMVGTYVQGVFSILTVGVLRLEGTDRRNTTAYLWNLKEKKAHPFSLIYEANLSNLLGFHRRSNDVEQWKHMLGLGLLPRHLSVTPDGEHAVVCHENRNVYILSLGSYSIEQDDIPDYQVYTGHRESVTCGVTLADNQRFVSASSDWTLRVWTIGNTKQAKVLTGHTGGVDCLVASPDGHLVISGSTDQTVRIWDVESGRCLRTFPGHTGCITALAISSDGTIAASASQDHTVRLWRLEGLGIARASWSLCLPQQASQVEENTQAAREGIREASLALEDGRSREAGQILVNVRQLAGFENDPRIIELMHTAGQRAGQCRGLHAGFSRRYFSSPRSKTTCIAISADGHYLAAGCQNKTALVWNLADGSLLYKLKASSDISALAFTPNSRQLLLGSKDKSIRVYSLEYGQLEQRLEGHRGRIQKIKPSQDGRRVFSQAADPTVRLWDLETGECNGVFSHKAFVTDFVTGWEEQFMASTDGAGELVTWNLHGGKRRAILCSEGQALYAVGISADGSLVASGGVDGKVRGWETEIVGEKGGVCQFVLGEHPGPVNLVRFLPDGQRLLTRCLKGENEWQFNVWDFKRSKLLDTFEGLSTLCLTGDGRFGIGVNFSEQLPVWELGKPGEKTIPHPFVAAAHYWEKHYFWDLQMTPDGHFIAARDGATGVAVWKLSWDYEFPEPTLWDEQARPMLEGFLRQKWYAQQISFASISLEDSDQDELQTHLGIHGFGWLLKEGVQHEAERTWAKLCTSNHPVGPALPSTQLAQSQIELAVKAMAEGQGARAYSLLRALQQEPAYEKDPKIQALLAQSGRWGIRGVMLSAWPLLEKKKHKDHLYSAAISPDGQQALTAGEEDFVLLWNLATGATERILSDRFHTVCFSPDGEHALAASNVLDLFRVRDWGWGSSFKGEAICTNAVCFSNDGNHVLTGHHDHSLRYWDWGGCRRILQGHQERVTSVAFSPDGKLAYSGSDDCKVKCWDLAQGECKFTINDHEGRVQAIAISPDGQWGVSGGNHELMVWNTQTGKVEKELVKILANIRSVCFSHDGKWLVTGDDNGLVRLWAMSNGNSYYDLDFQKGLVVAVCFSQDSQLLLTAGTSGKIRLWNLDWEFEFPEPADWDSGARPYLDAFLTMHTPYAGKLPTDHQPKEDEITLVLTRRGQPNWSETDFQNLLSTLSFAGYGWLRSKGVHRKLEEMAAERGG